MVTLLLTRPEKQSRAFLGQLEAEAGHAVPAVIAPLFRVVPVLAAIPATGVLIFTSGRAVELAGDLTGRIAFCVGDTTADLAARAGAKAVSASGTVEDLLELLLERRPGALVHLRGEVGRGDLVPRLNARGITASELVIYRTEVSPPSPEALALLSGSRPVVAPVFSPRSAVLLAALPAAPKVFVIAISAAAARPFAGRDGIEIARRPETAEMIRLVLRRLRNLS